MRRIAIAVALFVATIVFLAASTAALIWTIATLGVWALPLLFSAPLAWWAWDAAGEIDEQE